MPLTPEQARKLIEIVEVTRDHELTCDECLDEIAEFVEVKLAGRTLDDALQAVQDHLEICEHCNDEYVVLRKAVESLDRND